VIKRALLPQIYTRNRDESLTFLKVGLTKGSRGDWSQKDRFPLYERQACLSGETSKSWVLVLSRSRNWSRFWRDRTKGI
jgi:hypothetical protein